MTEQVTEKKKRKKKHYLLRIAIIIAVIAGIILFMHIDYFNVNGIAVIGNVDMTDEEITRLSEIEIGESIFDVHPILVQNRIKKNLYIEDVNVDRKLPDKVEIKVKERKGNVQLKKGEKYVVVGNDRTVIDISEEKKRVTFIDGITVVNAEKGKEVEVKEEKTFQDSLALIETTENNDLFFEKVALDENKVRAVVYDHLICKGKYEDMIKSIESGTLKKVIYDRYQKGTEKGTINVYGNDYCFFTP